MKQNEPVLSEAFVEERIRDSFKKNKYCQSFEVNCKFPREAIQFSTYASKKLNLKAQIKQDIREQIQTKFSVVSMEQLPCEVVEQLESFIFTEYVPSTNILKDIYNLSLFFDSLRLRNELRLDETSVKSHYKRELSASEDLRKIIDYEITFE